MSELRGGCPEPFFQEENFPKNESLGFVQGRLCQPIGEGLTCCLPCPSTDWLYPESFKDVNAAADWINVIGLIACMFLLLSFAFLPVEKSHRHYLSICLVVAVMIMQLGFIVPLGAKPEQCFDVITPNGMRSNLVCAFSGAFIAGGGWSGLMWVFMRALALHLQICWQVVMGKSFMYGALAVGWGVPAIGLALAMIFSGVSFRFGKTCHINHDNSLADFWIPLLLVAGVTVIIQFSTFGYCIKVYLASLADSGTTTNSSGLPSYSGSVMAVTPRQAYRRVQRVVQLQWRGIALVLIIVTDVILFSVVFVLMDNDQLSVANNSGKSTDWLTCLMGNKDDHTKCLHIAQHLVLGISTVSAVLILLSINGIWLLLLMCRSTMISGWVQLFKSPFRANGQEFISADASKPYSKDPRSYEMLACGRNGLSDSKAEVPLTPLSPAAYHQGTRSGNETPQGYFGREARYQNPSHSFSSPKPPNGRDWNPAATQTPSYGQSPTSPGGGYGQKHMDPLSMNKI